MHGSDSPTEIAPDITLEAIGLFLKARGWHMVTERCFEDGSRILGGVVHWTAALEVQLDRDHKAAAASMARGLGTLAAHSGGAGVAV